MISLEEARRIVATHVSALEAHNAGWNALPGRVLAEDICTDMDHPSADRSMMDGYLVREDSQPGNFRVIAEIAADGNPSVPLDHNEAFRIFTGAMLPPGGGRVVMQEDCERSGEQVKITAFSGQIYIRRKGSEAKVGDVILEKGTQLCAAEMAILAQLGRTNPMTIRPPVVIHIATGAELIDPSESPAPGQIRDSNSSLISGLLAPYLPDLSQFRTGDCPEEILGAIQGEFDILLISGGASVGDHDHGAEVLRKAGFTIHFERINLRPGKPLTFATRGRQVAFVIPGNPVSHFVCFHTVIRLALEMMCGIRPQWDFLDLEISDPDIIRPDPRETFWPARVEQCDGRLLSIPLVWSTSGNTFSIAGANALIRVNGLLPARTLLLDLPCPPK